MNYTIRNYKDSDYEMLKNWWNSQNQREPSKELIPNETTFILEVDNEPVVSISVFLTNVRGMCFLENFIGNPLKKGDVRKECSSIIVNYALKFAKELGYKRAVCFSYEEALKKRYQDLGMTKTLDNLSSFVKEL